MPALQLAADELDSVARGTLAPGAGHEGRARRAEAVKALADLLTADHDCDVVTELPASPLLDSVPLEPVLPVPLEPELLDSVPLEPELLDSVPLDCVPLDSLALDSVLLDSVLLAALADSPEPLVLVAFDFAESDGSWPDASCS